MRIKKLEIVGFKSFKDRTVIQFDAGITGIVGPNGCGKSNIVDALVWVMGEMSAKHLRGSSMEDVIFAGADGYSPAGMAEVSLTLENDGGPFPAMYAKHSEIMVTRRLNRNGESEYLVNKEPARLRDIHEVFMDTGAGSKGFSIIEQGAIGKIITAKPEDRRTLIEEAAGITKFKVRKRESQRKLDSTEQNLVRLQDILGEQKRQLDSLQRQAQRAERYRNLKNEVRDKDLWLSSKNYLKMRDEAETAQKIFDETKETEVTASADLGQKQAELAELQLALTEKEKLVESRQIENSEAQSLVQKLELEIRELRFEIEQAKRDKEVTGSILSQYQARQVALAADQERLTSSFSEVSTLATDLSAKYLEQKEIYQSTQARIQQIDEELTLKRREMLTVSQSESHMDAKLVSVTERTSAQDEKLVSMRAVHEELKTQQDDFQKRRNKVHASLESERQMQLDIMKDVESFAANLESLQGQVERKQEEVATFKDNLNEVSSRLYGLENLQENFEGFQEGVKNIMLWQRQKAETHVGGQVEFKTAYQPLAELVEVPEAYELAMEAALGQRLQLLVTGSKDQSLSAVDYLKEAKSGRSSFLSQDLVDTSSAKTDLATLKAESGVEACLDDVVQSPEAVRSQVSYFLKDIVIVDSIRTALRLRAAYPAMTFVTMDGDTLSADGVLTGGASESAESGVLKRRREIKELSQKREEWAGKLALAQGSLKKLEAQLKNMTEELQMAHQKRVEKEVQVAELKKDLERAENELSNSKKALDKQDADLNREQAHLMQLQGEVADLTERITEVRERKLFLETTVESLTTEYRSSRDGIDQLQSEVTNLQVQSTSRQKEAEGLQHQLDMVERSLKEVTESLAKMSEESEKNTETLSVNQLVIEEKRVELEHSIQKAERIHKEMSEVREEYEQALAKAREVEKIVSTTLQGINQYQARIGEAQLKLEQLRMKEQYLLDQVMERYMLDLRDEAPKYRETEGDFTLIEKEVAELKSKLSKIGEVNLSAIEEYDDLISRYEFLNQQFTDLTDAKEQLKKVIDRINRICSRRFKETFEQVNERFTKVFPVLFGGGEARLILIEDTEKGEMGIDIVAKPPGKKLQSVSLLSGGEKALTAVSLIFSIFLVKPSPFCLLDEVDAPLDDANVFRFNDLVKEMAKRSQIIIVTHNKHTMKVNDKLYGVTMEEKGVSKMVSVSLQDAGKVVAS